VSVILTKTVLFRSFILYVHAFLYVFSYTVQINNDDGDDTNNLRLMFDTHGATDLRTNGGPFRVLRGTLPGPKLLCFPRTLLP